MAAGECEHGEVIGMPCPPCTNAKVPVLRAALGIPEPWGEPFMAQYLGHCSGCDAAILPGEIIVGRDLPDDDGREYRHNEPDCTEA